MPSLGVLGTGQVGQAIVRRAAEVGYDVTVGARSADSPSLAVFRTPAFPEPGTTFPEPGERQHAQSAGSSRLIATGSFADAVRSAPVVVNATNGLHSLDVLTSVGADALAGKVLVDVANELRPVEHGYPVPVASAEDSLGQRLQRAFPGTAVVKTLNTMNSSVMVRPAAIPGDHLVFLSGDSSEAKDATRTLLHAFGWRDPQILDLGGIETAAAAEMMMAIWMRVTLARGAGAPRFNWAVLDSTAS